MFDINELSQYLVIVIIGLCCCVGYIIKTSLDFIPNKYIPLILACIGVIANICLNHSVTVEIVLGGMLSGLASTGFHEAMRDFLGDKKSIDEDDLEELEDEIKDEILEEIRQDIIANTTDMTEEADN